MALLSPRPRLALSVLLIVATVAVFAGRLVDIQVVQAAALNQESLGRRSITSTVYGSRGTILDRNGVVLADSVMRYDITASPRFVKAFTRPGGAGQVSVEAAAAEIAALTGQQPTDVLTALRADPAADFAYVTKLVDADVLRAVQALGIPWIYYQPHPARTYPNGAVAGNLLGFVGSDNQAQAGVELANNACLAGRNGSESYERGADGVRIPGSTVSTSAVKNGSSLLLTIDSDLQWFVQQSLSRQAEAVGARFGTVVVQEVKTGRLLAVADWPSVDPNNVGATPADARGSRAFTAPFEPGSTLKSLTAAALLDAGLATPNSRVVAPYRFTTPDGAAVSDSEYHPTWNLTLTGVLKESSNTGMSQLGLRMSQQQRYAYLKRFRLGTPTEVSFGAQASGDLGGTGTDGVSPNWDAQSNLATMFGQGMTATAVQMASIYQTLGNGGVRLPVSLVAGCRAADGSVTSTPSTPGTPVVSPAAARSTVDMLETMASKGWLANQIAVPGYRLATKTGTAQQPDGKGGYSSSYLVSLAGLAPADDPQYVVSVSLADPVKMNTSAATAPIFREVMTQVLKSFRVVPSGSSSPDLATNF